MTRTTDDSTAGTFTEATAATFVTQFAQRFADETTTWIGDSTKAFVDCFERARTSGYTADALVGDMAAMWTRNLDYLGRLVKLAVPPKHQAGGEPGGAEPAPDAGAAASGDER